MTSNSAGLNANATMAAQMVFDHPPLPVEGLH